MDQWRTGGPHVNLAGPCIIKPLNGVLKLCAPDDGILAEQQSLALDQLADGDEFHPGDQVSHVLVLGHETPRPGGGIFDKRTAIWQVNRVGITNRVARTGIGYSGDDVHLYVVCLSECGAAAISHVLDIDILVVGGRVTVINPQEGANLHFIARRALLLNPVGGDPDDFSGAKVFLDQVVQIRKGGGFQCYRPRLLFTADDNGRSSEFVPCGVDSLAGQQQDGTGTFDGFHGPGDPVLEAALLVDQGGDEFRRVDLVPAHLGKMYRPLLEGLLGELFAVGDLPYGDNGVDAQMRTDDQRLVLMVADYADAHSAVHPGDVLLELGPELGVLDVMDETDKTVLVQRRQPAAFRSQMRVIIRSVEKVIDAVIL